MDKIYEQYGYSQETLINKVYEGKEGAEKINRIMDLFRNEVNSEFANLKIESTTDLKKNPGEYPVSDVLGFHFEEGTHLWLDHLGQSPKLNFIYL